MTAEEYFDGVADAVRARREAELLLEFGTARAGSCPGRADPSAGGPTFAEAAASEEARARIAEAERAVGEGLRVIAGLRLVYSRKADVLELRYVDLLPWDGVAAELGVARRTCMRWRDELLDWVDAVGFARAALGVGFAGE